MPNFVVLDSTIPPLAKILYSEIVALSHKDGYCYASNTYLGELNHVDERTIRRLLKQLASADYIKIIIDKSKPNKFRRKIFINEVKGQNCPICVDDFNLTS